MKYDLEIPKIVKKIKEKKHQTVLLQFPDGLKPKAIQVAEKIQKKTSAKVMVWAGSNYGACDTPEFKADLIINFGHSKMKF